MATIQGGSSTAGVTNVNAEFELQVDLTEDVSKAGIVVVAGESGAATDPAGRLARALETTPDFRLRTVTDNVLCDENFLIQSAQPSTILAGVSTSTIAWTGAGTGVQLNSTLTTASGNGAGIGTWGQFKVASEGTLYVSFTIGWNTVSTNAMWAIGLASGVAAASQFTTYAGIRRTSGGALELVIRRNSVDIATTTITDTYSTSLNHHFVLCLTSQRLDCWIDGALAATLSFESGTTAKPFMLSSQLFLCATQWNESTVSGTGVALRIAEWSVWDAGEAPLTRAETAALRDKYLPHSPAGQGVMSQWTNSAAHTTVTLSNTTTTLGSSTSGALVAFAAIASAATDYVVLGFQPDGSVVNGRFMLTGVSVSGQNAGAANSGTVPTTLIFGVAVNGDTIALNTTDSVSTRLAKRQPIGVMSLPVNAVVGQPFDRNIDINFANPMGIDRGHFCHLLVKVVSGAATASQVIQLNVQLRGYWL